MLLLSTRTLWHLLEIGDTYYITCSRQKKHVVIWFGPLINVAASELFIFLISSVPIKISEYNCHTVRDHIL